MRLWVILINEVCTSVCPCMAAPLFLFISYIHHYPSVSAQSYVITVCIDLLGKSISCLPHLRIYEWSSLANCHASGKRHLGPFWFYTSIVLCTSCLAKWLVSLTYVFNWTLGFYMGYYTTISMGINWVIILKPSKLQFNTLAGVQCVWPAVRHG